MHSCNILIPTHICGLLILDIGSPFFLFLPSFTHTFIPLGTFSPFHSSSYCLIHLFTTRDDNSLLSKDYENERNTAFELQHSNLRSSEMETKTTDQNPSTRYGNKFPRSVLLPKIFTTSVEQMNAGIMRNAFNHFGENK